MLNNQLEVYFVGIPLNCFPQKVENVNLAKNIRLKEPQVFREQAKTLHTESIHSSSAPLSY